MTTRTLDDAGREITARMDFEQRMKAAGDRAEYELGDRSWAGVILGAFLYPEADSDNLAREKEV